MYFINIGGEWVSKNWAMAGPTGCMMDKVVPEPWQTRIQKAYEEQGKREAEQDANLKRKGLRPPKPKAETKPKRTPRKRKKKDDDTLSIKELEKLILKESKKPTTVRKKKSGVVGGGMSLTGGKK